MRRGSTIGGALIAACFAVVAAALDITTWVFLAIVAAFAFWWMTPPRPRLCHMCERDIHPHDYYDGPDDEEVVYGHIAGIGHLVHVSELDTGGMP